MRVFRSLKDVIASMGREDFRNLYAGSDPFFQPEFLLALEDSGSLQHNSDWQPEWLLSPDKLLVPFYKRLDSQGEFIFDMHWAAAYHRAGIGYYPKATIAVPFTPAGRGRILGPDRNPQALSRAAAMAVDYARERKYSSLHALFVSAEEAAAFEEAGCLTRITLQYQLEADGFRDYAGYLAALRSKRRKEVRREREGVIAAGIEVRCLTGYELKPEFADLLYRLYTATYDRKWGDPYLTRSFFERVIRDMPHAMMVVLASREDKPIAMSFNFLSDDTVYGRYWGTFEHVQHLHFEVCYYSLIEFALNTGRTRVEAGAQGEHKFSRGFLARPIYSSHILMQPAAHQSLGSLLQRENRAYLDQIAAINSVSPFHRDDCSTNQVDGGS